MVGMYSARRTAARPPPIIRRPRQRPLSRFHGQADQGGNPAPRQLAHLGQVGDQRGRGDVPTAGCRGQQVLRLPPHGAGAHEARDLAFELLDRAREPRDVDPNALLQVPRPRLAVPVLLGDWVNTAPRAASELMYGAKALPMISLKERFSSMTYLIPLRTTVLRLARRKPLRKRTGSVGVVGRASGGRFSGPGGHLALPAAAPLGSAADPRA